MTTPGSIIAALGRHRFRLGDEKRLQHDIEKALSAEGLPVEREVKLDADSRIDFLIGSVGIEVKIKGGRMSIFRQLERYAAFDRIGSLILVTNAAMGMPKDIGGKPVFYVSLGAGWL